MKLKVHPKYKTKYHVGNWPEYERALVRPHQTPVDGTAFHRNTLPEAIRIPKAELGECVSLFR